ncbi:MAG TPA: 8-amino-7-oxononanoate synthase [Gammaproteobacteria bacterium]|nr:8-amino-7-oxononanoate synthase [Gammaproteobacteria bacterium]
MKPKITQQSTALDLHYPIRHRIPFETRNNIILGYQGRKIINFCSNDYLGLSQHPAVLDTLQKAVREFGMGSTASQYVSGYYQPQQILEERFSAFLSVDKALYFSSGFLANLAVISTLCKPKDLIFTDKYLHASLLDGIKLSGAKNVRYHHCDPAHLAKRLQDNHAPHQFILSESVFSMQGSLAPLPSIIQLSQQHKALLIVDDAHGIGVLGPKGRGCLEWYGLSQKDIPLLICPLGKAFGGMGAIVAGKTQWIDYLTQKARPLIYSTAPPPAWAKALCTSLDLVEKEPERREKLQELTHQFQTLAASYDLPFLPSKTPIQGIRVGASDKAEHLSQALFRKGYWVAPIRPPTVPQNQACLRITMNVHHSIEHLTKLVRLIKQHA